MKKLLPLLLIVMCSCNRTMYYQQDAIVKNGKITPIGERKQLDLSKLKGTFQVYGTYRGYKN